jgi:phosphate transport system protein
MPTLHTNKSFDSDLRLLSDHVLLLTGRVERMIACSIKALSENNRELAKETINFDQVIDKDEMLIDRQCLELLAQRQPLGQDLRFIVAILKMVTYFERLGDLAVKICGRVLKQKPLNDKSALEGIEKMGSLVQAMMKEMEEAFLLKDNARAMKVIKQDDLIDEVYVETSRLIIKKMTHEHEDMEAYYNLLSIAKWLERMGDHCTNLAELIIFMIKGEDVRHQQLHGSRRD